jgi:hypothetical protein
MLSSATMAGGKGNLFEIVLRNIITTKSEELLEESRKAVESRNFKGLCRSVEWLSRWS